MHQTTLPTSVVIENKRRSRLAEFFTRLVKEKPLGAVCGIIILMMILVAIFASALAPYPYEEMHLIDRLQGPSGQYLLGTDQMGRDFLSRIVYGTRISLLVGLTVTTVSVVISTLIGGSSGFLMGKFDMFLQRFCDAWECFPYLL
ncbi:ABC transporter permease, partial [Dehalococcoidia bacterium]|nr:ABC transporter permease [Dehalococcoidia bacterium]